MRWHVAIAAVLLAGLTAAALAQEPIGTAFTYQGLLKQNGAPVTGTANFVFSLWDAPVDGNDVAYFEAPSDYPIFDGLFTVEVDFSMTEGWIYDGTALWLQVAAEYPAGSGDWETLAPRQRLTTVPYASFAHLSTAVPWAGILDMPAGFADGVDDVGEGDFWAMTGNEGTTPGTHFVGTTDNTPLELHVDGSRALRIEPTGDLPNFIAGHYTNHADPNVIAGTIGGGGFNSVHGWHSTIGGGIGNEIGTSYNATIAGGDYNMIGDVAGWATIAGGRENEATQEYAMIPGGSHNLAGGEYSFAAGRLAKVRDPNAVGGGDTNGDEGTFVWADSHNEEFWSTGPNQFLIRAAGGVGINTNDPEATLHVVGTAFGQKIDVWSPPMPGFLGYGTHVELDANNGYGLYAEATRTDAEITYGVYGKSSNVSTDATATGFGGYFRSDGTYNGAGVYGHHRYKGVHGFADGNGGAGVYGRHWTDTNGYGGYFLTQGNRSSAGVVGTNTSNYDSEGRLGYVGPADEFPLVAGVYGQEAGSGYGYAGYFVGGVNVTGWLSKGGGSFKIDHPLDPEHKYLMHSFVESPDMMNVYNGNVTTDVDGFAVVKLPDWFETLNRDFRYQLTVIGQFAQAIVAEEIRGNTFVIQTDKPRVKVSWQVTGIRQDPWANANRIPVEVDKPENEQGTYLHPDAYGVSADRGVNYEQRVGIVPPPGTLAAPRDVALTQD